MHTSGRGIRIFMLMCFLIAPGIGARNPDGTLGLLRTPNNGMPALITPSEKFEVVAEAEAVLSLSGEAGTFSLETEWSPLPGGRHRGQCAATAPLPAGVYALHGEFAENKDENLRAVYVLESFPEAYQFAHITDTHIGTTRHPRADSAIILDIIEAVNGSEAAFALFTGDLTENGEPEQFRRFLEVLDTCRVPTFVVPGNHDRQGSNYQLFFGPMTYAFRFGDDGYLAFDTKDFLVADEMGLQDGLLHYYRRQIRASRWSVGFTHRYDVTMGMRAQLTVFVDDPLDYLLYGHYHREAGPQDGVPWGYTESILTPAAINGIFRMIGVDGRGLHVGESITAAAIQLEGE